MTLKARLHRGSLADSLKTEIEVTTAKDVIDFFGENKLQFKYCGIDGRFKELKHTWYVLGKGGVLGMVRAGTFKGFK